VLFGVTAHDSEDTPVGYTIKSRRSSPRPAAIQHARCARRWQGAGD
jgi:hypothetical protein